MSHWLIRSHGYLYFLDKNSLIALKKKIELNFAIAKSIKFLNSTETLNAPWSYKSKL